MQAITIAIGKKGISYFIQKFIAVKLTQEKLSTLRPADHNISVDSFNVSGAGNNIRSYDIFTVSLNQGYFKNFVLSFKDEHQIKAGTPNGNQFRIHMVTPDGFTAGYQWGEQYKYRLCDINSGCSAPTSGEGGPYDYTINITNMDCIVNYEFVYSDTSKSYSIQPNAVSCIANIAPKQNASIPNKSLIHYISSDDCFDSSINDTIMGDIDNMGLGQAVTSLFSDITKTIPASGRLTDNIMYDFAIGDSKLAFPNADGITLGVTGSAIYKGPKGPEEYKDPNPPSLPVPPVPSDDDEHHLCVYVSNYAFNALNWAYWKDEKLKLTLLPSDVPDPKMLRVKTYINKNKPAALVPYEAHAMQADISPKKAPITSFQTIYNFTSAAMKILQDKLPPEVYNAISSSDMNGNTYTNTTDIESELNELHIILKWFPLIEEVTKTRGMVTTQDIEFTLTILTGGTHQPQLVFDVTRTDFMTGLKLGHTQTAQTIQFDFVNLSSSTTFKSTTVPGLKPETLDGSNFWNAVDTNYAGAMNDLGKTGTPLPIMKDFQFLFDDAVLTLNDGYISILAKVEFKGN